ncbi:unnamed protein product [Tenebrio molitor]|nr:unnamed protein product [Tenebrio molitor]
MFIIHDDTNFGKLCPNDHVDKCQRLLVRDKYKLITCGSNPGCGRWFYVSEAKIIIVGGASSSPC